MRFVFLVIISAFIGCVEPVDEIEQVEDTSPLISATIYDIVSIEQEYFNLIIDIKNWDTPYYAMSMRILYDTTMVEYYPGYSDWIGRAIWGYNSIGFEEVKNGVLHWSISRIGSDEWIHSDGELSKFRFRPLRLGMSEFSIDSENVRIYNEEGTLLPLIGLTFQGDSLDIR